MISPKATLDTINRYIDEHWENPKTLKDVLHAENLTEEHYQKLWGHPKRYMRATVAGTHQAPAWLKEAAVQEALHLAREEHPLSTLGVIRMWYVTLPLMAPEQFDEVFPWLSSALRSLAVRQKDLPALVLSGVGLSKTLQAEQLREAFQALKALCDPKAPENHARFTGFCLNARTPQDILSELAFSDTRYAQIMRRNPAAQGILKDVATLEGI